MTITYHVLVLPIGSHVTAIGNTYDTFDRTVIGNTNDTYARKITTRPFTLGTHIQYQSEYGRKNGVGIYTFDAPIQDVYGFYYTVKDLIS